MERGTIVAMEQSVIAEGWLQVGLRRMLPTAWFERSADAFDEAVVSQA
jgi:hypothetical protein